MSFCPQLKLQRREHIDKTFLEIFQTKQSSVICVQLSKSSSAVIQEISAMKPA